jgi:hypothetical protein
MSQSVICIAHSQTQAETIVNNLQYAGILPSDVSVLMPDRSGTRDFAHEHNTKAPEGATSSQESAPWPSPEWDPLLQPALSWRH